MKRLILIFLLLSGDQVARTWEDSETLHPIQDYAEFHGLKSNRVVYLWEVDLSNDGRRAMLLDTKLIPSEIQQEREETKDGYNPDIRSFTVYFQNPEKGDYVQSKGLEEDGVLGTGAGITVDVTQCYVGYIFQMKHWGLVTVDSEDAKDKRPAVASIYAYVVEGDHIKRHLLATYNPQKGINPIYKEYLSEAKRTKVQVQEVKP